jgi:two-component system alkaline phosphatase synthesis response regulator PhoP
MKKKIFVVDDEIEIVELTKMILEKEGYEVLGTSSSAQIFEQLKDYRPDLILLDINMPDMDGWEVLRSIKMDSYFSSIPVVLFTIRSELRDKIHGIQGGAYDYITKPFSYDELISRVQKIFQNLEHPSENPSSVLPR